MMKQLKLKLKQKKGETLVEALVSMLIIVLAMGLLSSSVIASARINLNNRKMDEQFKEDLMRAETFQADEEHRTKNINLVIKFTGIENPTTVTGVLYGGDNGAFAAYSYEVEVAAP